ncbi:MAG: NAD(P)-binding protein [Haliea sp.]|nr:NAD(P)-binding protein [Haliea sp.]
MVARWPPKPRIAIIGRHVRIAAVVKLQRAGYTDLTVYEKADKVGGTWRENTYPGLSCDVPSRWYSFSFALKPDWSHRFSYGADIQAYLEKVATDFGVTQKVTFNTAVTELRYESPCWRLATATGESRRFMMSSSPLPVFCTNRCIQDCRPGHVRRHCVSPARWDHLGGLARQTRRHYRHGVHGVARIIRRYYRRWRKCMSSNAPHTGCRHSANRLLRQMESIPGTVPVHATADLHYYCQLMVRTFSAATIGNKLMQRWMSQICQNTSPTRCRTRTCESAADARLPGHLQTHDFLLRLLPGNLVAERPPDHRRYHGNRTGGRALRMARCIHWMYCYSPRALIPPRSSCQPASLVRTV